ncbi:MAG TPA: STAS domain-containing protein [Gammaproteobacteria bacterium]|nr:STAS domain-containing protein [Gammaproteobacteria bacterium]
MTIRILKPEDVVIACIEAPLSDDDLLDLRDTLIESVSTSRTRGVVVDMTGVDVVDFFTSRALRDLTQANRTQGAHTVVVGIPPHVSFAMGRLGVSLDDIPTAADLQEGLAYLDSLDD